MIGEHDPFTSPEVRRDSKESRRPLADRERDAFRETLKHPWGRLALRAVLRLANLDDDSFTTNTSLNAHRQGQQSVGNGLLRRLREVSLEHVQLMEREAADDQDSPA